MNQQVASHRAGRYVRQPTGYRAFMPAPLPPDRPVALTGELPSLLSRPGPVRYEAYVRLFTDEVAAEGAA